MSHFLTIVLFPSPYWLLLMPFVVQNLTRGVFSGVQRHHFMVGSHLKFADPGQQRTMATNPSKWGPVFEKSRQKVVYDRKYYVVCSSSERCTYHLEMTVKQDNRYIRSVYRQYAMYPLSISFVPLSKQSILTIYSGTF